MAELDAVLGKGRIPITLDGKAYTARTLTMADMGEFRARVKEAKLALLMKVGIPPDILGVQIDKVLNATAKVEYDERGEVVSVDDPILSEMTTMEGVQLLLYLSLRKEHPDIKLEDVDFPLAELASMTEVIGKLMGAEVGAEAPFDQAKEE